MKPQCPLLFLLFFVMLHAAFAQTISTQKGLTTAVFTLPEGTITVYLPDDIRSGDFISGTIQVVPAGKTARQAEKNLGRLTKFMVELGGQRFAVPGIRGTLQHQLDNISSLHRFLRILNSEGVQAGETIIRCMPARQPSLQSGCSVPTHALTAAPFRVTGSFDGNSSNTQCRLGDQPAAILAESPRECIMQFPVSGSGMQRLVITENGMQECSGTVSGVEMQVTSGRLSLRRGERTFIRVDITGLQGLHDTARLTLTNRTVDIILMQPSDDFVLLLPPDSVANGNYTGRFDVQSIRPGNFSVNVDLDLPQPPVYADNRGVEAGGIKLHPLEVDGLKNGMSDAFKKAVTEITGNRATKYPELDGCGSCLTCIQGMLDEGKVALVGDIGNILMDHYVDLLVGKAGGALAWIKDKFDKLEKAEDLAGAIADAVRKGEIQVVEFSEKMCGYCLVSAIGFYEARTQCMDAFFYCKGSKMCCTQALTIIHLKYCVNEDGFKIPGTGLDIDVISK